MQGHHPKTAISFRQAFAMAWKCEVLPAFQFRKRRDCRVGNVSNICPESGQLSIKCDRRSSQLLKPSSCAGRFQNGKKTNLLTKEAALLLHFVRLKVYKINRLEHQTSFLQFQFARAFICAFVSSSFVQSGTFNFVTCMNVRKLCTSHFRISH